MKDLTPNEILHVRMYRELGVSRESCILQAPGLYQRMIICDPDPSYRPHPQGLSQLHAKVFRRLHPPRLLFLWHVSIGIFLLHPLPPLFLYRFVFIVIVILIIIAFFVVTTDHQVREFTDICLCNCVMVHFINLEIIIGTVKCRQHANLGRSSSKNKLLTLPVPRFK